MTCSMVRTTVSVQVMDLLLVSMVEIEGEANLEVMMMLWLTDISFPYLFKVNQSLFS